MNKAAHLEAEIKKFRSSENQNKDKKVRPLFSTSYLLIFLASNLVLGGCTPKGTPIYILGTPHFVPQSQPDSVIETGIGQDPKTGGIFLQWFIVVEAAGYKIYRTDTTDINGSPIDFSIIRNVASSNVLNDTSIVDASSITTGVRYFYFLKAYASDGSTSNPSDTAHITLLPRPSLELPGVNARVDTSSLVFGWHDNTGGGYTVIRVQDMGPPIINVWVSKRFQIFNTNPQKKFDFDSTATEQLISGRSYQWRVDRFNVGADQEARSTWSTFTVN